MPSCNDDYCLQDLWDAMIAAESIVGMKNHLRQKVRQWRVDHAAEIPVIQLRICEHLQHWPVFQQAQTILGYMALPGEADLMSLFEGFPGKDWFFPRIHPETTLAFHRFVHGDALAKNRFGIPEPLDTAMRLSDHQSVDLVLMPALMADLHGYRLGYGKGYYDRFLNERFQGLSTKRLPLACIVPQQLCVAQLPVDPWDLAARWIVTEQGILEVS